MPLILAPEIREALAASQPTVALETSIIAQGLPYPANLEAAMEIEAAIRKAGAVPATIGLVEGAVRVGLDADQLDAFATRDDIIKVGAADLPYALVRSCMGATTVSAALCCADQAGIPVMATGGIGGIHRNWHETHDESQDLRAIAGARALLVASGAKAILDIPRTLERLETLGVAVIAYGQDAFPTFWSRDSGLAAPMRLDTVEEIAEFHALRTRLGNAGGLLIANPVPAVMEIPRATVETWIAAAVTDMQTGPVTGKSVTPLLLDRINVVSGGQSVATNRALVIENAALAARIAVALARHI